MRRLIFAALSMTLASGIGAATVASAAPQLGSAQHGSTQATCMYFQNPTVETVWSKVCHF
jgi:hypothetical protein